MDKHKKSDAIAKALAEAYKMLEQNRIKAMADDIANGEVTEGKYVERQLLRGKVKTWERYLAADVAEANGCGIFYDPEESLLEAYGRPGDLDIVEELFRFVYSQVADVTNEFSRSEHKDRKALGAFRLGVVDAIAEELEKAHDAAAAALKDLDPEVVDEAVEKLSGVLEEVLKWGDTKVDEPEENYAQPLHPSFKEGRKAGRNIQISIDKGDT